MKLEPIIGAFVLVVSLAIGWLYWDGRHTAGEQARRDRETSEYNRIVTECQVRFNKAVVDNIIGRSQLSSRETLAQRRLIQTVGQMMRHPPATTGAAAEQQRALNDLFADYNHAVDALERYRRAHPFPALPDCSVTANLALADAGMATVAPTASATP